MFWGIEWSDYNDRDMGAAKMRRTVKVTADTMPREILPTEESCIAVYCNSIHVMIEIRY